MPPKIHNLCIILKLKNFWKQFLLTDKLDSGDEVAEHSERVGEVVRDWYLEVAYGALEDVGEVGRHVKNVLDIVLLQKGLILADRSITQIQVRDYFNRKCLQKLNKKLCKLYI